MEYEQNACLEQLLNYNAKVNSSRKVKQQQQKKNNIERIFGKTLNIMYI